MTPDLHERPVDRGRLTALELASRAGSTQDRIVRLVEVGVLRPENDGSFDAFDVQRIQIVDAYERAGIELDHLATAIGEGRMSFEYTDRIYPEASPLSGRTLAELMSELGAAGTILPDVLRALGWARATPDRELTEGDERILRGLVAAWGADPFAPGPILRAARLLGDPLRRIAEGWVSLFLESVALSPEETASLSLRELEPRLFDPAIRAASVLEPAVIWAMRHSMQEALNAVNVETMERALEASGARAISDRRPPAVAFADLSGYTRLTEEEGDETAARHAEALAAMAAGIAATHGGRLVKQLGDGVMLAFDGAVEAVAAMVELRRAGTAASLPPLHIGVSAGPFVERDGDYYGRTVNLAARLSGLAGPGEIVLNDVAAHGVGEGRSSALSPAPLKGFAAPVAAFRFEDG